MAVQTAHNNAEPDAGTWSLTRAGPGPGYGCGLGPVPGPVGDKDGDWGSGLVERTARNTALVTLAPVKKNVGGRPRGRSTLKYARCPSKGGSNQKKVRGVIWNPRARRASPTSTAASTGATTIATSNPNTNSLERALSSSKKKTEKHKNKLVGFKEEDVSPKEDIQSLQTALKVMEGELRLS